MTQITIWHNPRCSKSRQALSFLQERDIDAEVVKYLDVSHSEQEIKKLLDMLGISARELMRTKEAVYKELGLKNVEDEDKLIKAMVENPKLIERPIVIKGDKAVIARPLERVLEII